MPAPTADPEPVSLVRALNLSRSLSLVRSVRALRPAERPGTLAQHLSISPTTPDGTR